MTSLSSPKPRWRFSETPVAERIARRWTTLVLWAAGLAWAAGFALLSADRHERYLSHRYDLGNMVQAVWSTAHGRFLEATLTDGTQASRLGAHVDPFLAAFAPIWWLWPSPVMLVTLQAVALASGALPVYWLARKHIGDARCALCLASAYLLYPAVQWNALNDFHAVTFSIPLLLFCVWFLDEDRLVWGVLFAVLACTTKEDIPLVIAGIGVWYAVRSRRWIVGAMLAVLGIGWTLVDLYVVIPHYSGGSSLFYDRLGSVGGSPGGLATTLVTHPLRVWDTMTTGADLRYLAALLVPLLFLWALEPLLALAASPVLVVSLLSGFGPMTSVRYQSVAAPVACLFAAAAIGAGRLGHRSAFVVSLAALVIAAIAAWGGPLGALDAYGEAERPSTAKLDAMRHAVALIPNDAAVSASNRIGAHLSDRRRIFIFPVHAEADWVIVDEADTISEAASQTRVRSALTELRTDPTWREVFDEAGVRVYRSRGSVTPS